MSGGNSRKPSLGASPKRVPLREALLALQPAERLLQPGRAQLNAGSVEQHPRTFMSGRRHQGATGRPAGASALPTPCPISSLSLSAVYHRSQSMMRQTGVIPGTGIAGGRKAGLEEHAGRWGQQPVTLGGWACLTLSITKNRVLQGGGQQARKQKARRQKASKAKGGTGGVGEQGWLGWSGGKRIWRGATRQGKRAAHQRAGRGALTWSLPSPSWPAPARAPPPPQPSARPGPARRAAVGTGGGGELGKGLARVPTINGLPASMHPTPSLGRPPPPTTHPCPAHPPLRS